MRERIAAWFKRRRDYEPPPGRLSEDTTQRLPSGGGVQRLPGDGVDPATVNPQAGLNP
jgi:hypothetical protein